MYKPKIAIVGGGIIGVTTGHTLLDLFRHQLQSVTIISEQWTPQTTGDVSAGLILPYAFGDKTDPELHETLFGNTVKHIKELVNLPNGKEIGISQCTTYQLYQNDQEKTELELPESLSKHLPLYRNITEEELKQFPNEWKLGTTIVSFMLEPKLFLPYLMKEFESLGGKFSTNLVESLQSLLDYYDIVINCTGLGSRYLEDVGDINLVPIRGQVVRVHAPWIQQSVMAGDFYILVNNHCVVLGGTKDKNFFNLKPNDDVTKKIIKGCCELVPSLEKAQLHKTECGLRPYRSSVRIENDLNNDKIIHNYGHGGSGVTLCFGSALKVAELVYTCFLK